MLDAYGTARELVFATMRYRMMPTMVIHTCRWALDKAYLVCQRAAPRADQGMQ